MIDCHCHLADNEFEKDLADVVDRAKQAGVAACLVNTECKEEFERAIQLKTDYEGFLLPCFGVHPVQYDITPDVGPVPRSSRLEDLTEIDSYFEKYKDQLIAIGETGLDFTPRYIRHDGDKDIQQKVFKHQIDLSRKFDLPLICHSRSAGKPVISFLREHGAKNVLLHAFDGNAKSAQGGIDAGYYFSIPPSVVRSDQKKSLISKIPMEQLLLETDSPVLGPNKDDRNEPKNIIISADYIAHIKNLDVEMVKKITTENALKLFPKLKSFIKL